MAQDDLFAAEGRAAPEPEAAGGAAAMHTAPLAARMRPQTLEEFVGQQHLLAPGLLLRRAIEADRIQSLIFYGPPGTGKTTLAQIIARRTRCHFERLSGVESNVADMRRVLAAAAYRLRQTGQPTLLLVDEIHRFNKAQQDVLLPEVENGAIRLIGATTHNPFFFVNSPLVSRSQIFELQPLSEEELLVVLPGRHAAEGGRGGVAAPGAGGGRRRPEGLERPGDCGLDHPGRAGWFHSSHPGGGRAKHPEKGHCL
jgi:putative ATPase